MPEFPLPSNTHAHEKHISDANPQTEGGIILVFGQIGRIGGRQLSHCWLVIFCPTVAGRLI